MSGADIFLCAVLYLVVVAAILMIWSATVRDVVNEAWADAVREAIEEAAAHEDAVGERVER